MDALFWGVLAHMIGDYLLQSDWMAVEKTKRWLPAILHGLTYTIPFLFLTHNIWALLLIASTHIIIDRYRLAKRLVWIKNFLAPRSWWRPWKDCDQTGYPNDRPIWMTTWLLIIADNVLHIAINSATLLLIV